jgi:hypothetical protein
MELIRLTDQYSKLEDGVHRDLEAGVIGVFFRSYGKGDERTSDFRINLAWSDVEKIIVEFATMGEAGAVNLQQAQKLAKAARAAGWSP